MSITFYAHRVDASTRPLLDGPNFASDNALALLRALDLPTKGWGGQCARAALECALMRAEGAITIARATGRMGRLDAVVRAPKHSARHHIIELDLDGVGRRLALLVPFLERAAELGAAWISWS